jgi:hypothetical protein
MRIPPVIIPEYIAVASAVEQHIGDGDSQDGIVRKVTAPIEKRKLFSFDRVPLVNRANDVTRNGAYHV